MEIYTLEITWKGREKGSEYSRSLTEKFTKENLRMMSSTEKGQLLQWMGRLKKVLHSLKSR
jgi:hypothetical protein